MDSQIVVIITVFSVFQFLFSSAVVDSKFIALSLSRQKHSPSSSSIQEELQRLVKASKARAQSFQKSKLTTTSAVDEHVDIPLFPRSYGGYSLSLSFGTPPQTLSYIMDTGSSLTWFPCTSNFTCKDCNFTGVGKIQTFIPEDSSSSGNVSCNSTQCKWLFPGYECLSEEVYCPVYDYTYGVGETKGWLMSEFLTFPDDDQTCLDNFAVGCSDHESGNPSGIVGFGRAPYSLPSQMELDSFSYCMVSHEFDNNKTMSSDLVLITKEGGGGGGGGSNGEIVHYTPLIYNQIHEDFYYVRLQNITVGNVNITVPDKYQVPNINGNGGTIVDSGTSLTFMEESVFDLVVNEFKKQIIGKNRNTTAENETSLELCINVKSFNDIPTLSLLFDEGAVMDLPMKNYFLNVEDSVVCLLMMTTQSADLESIGPAIILGNYLQQDFYVEFNIKQNRFGFLKHTCHTK